jgi:hypothetical protein
MKSFTHYRIIFLLFAFGINNLYAVQTATVNQSKMDEVTAISTTKIINNGTKKNKRKTKLTEKIKEKLALLFPINNTQKQIPKNENLETKTHGLAVAALVCGILGIFTFGILSILAIIFGAISLKKIKRSGGFYTGRGMAIAGLVLGIILVAIFLFVLFIALAFERF